MRSNAKSTFSSTLRRLQIWMAQWGDGFGTMPTSFPQTTSSSRCITPILFIWSIVAVLEEVTWFLGHQGWNLGHQSGNLDQALGHEASPSPRIGCAHGNLNSHRLERREQRRHVTNRRHLSWRRLRNTSLNDGVRFGRIDSKCLKGHHGRALF